MADERVREEWVENNLIHNHWPNWLTVLRLS
jgi:hypothetical protein